MEIRSRTGGREGAEGITTDSTLKGSISVHAPVTLVILVADHFANRRVLLDMI